jgi:membrane protein DedA with SNARE-associated domain
MNLQTILLSALATYGVPAVFVSILLASIGVPLPASFLLIVAGSFVASGDLQLVPVLIAGTAGAILGDHIGYGIGWFGGQTLTAHLGRRFSAQGLLDRAEAMSRKWGGVSVFFSRWLVTSLGPYINLTSGVAQYALHRFTLWDILGEALWVVLYVKVGQLFSDRVAEISDILGEFTWVALGLIAVIVLGYQLFKTLRSTN